jgi:hypothetical protein
LWRRITLAEDFRVKYAPDKIVTVADARANDGFFADAHDVFLHGLTGQRREGTCSSLPVIAFLFVGGSLWLEGLLSKKLCGEPTPPGLTATSGLIALVFMFFKFYKLGNHGK